ncbi:MULTISPECIES: glutathione synthase [Bosea]|jgi:glutathione synthase|uniref:glutathione synthase n=1 Tax=Bosea TaxID=85413 RepID=UPI00214FBC89|nr:MULTISPECIES: glutathione synthase [Bosea]MCR4522021.1 glutathione synthase [Bosea sp. 47.2.35]MDR6829501.1 glutathione synthase [Bosea robiniae]MDR6896384.1 glutathione synthase [Bosea sp. BE109]MDR7139782.1 glutathione synthase [Bosea sp. BE168]MDR7176496.1 glutathione synthase [Bosea sp. BE271]
MSLNVAIQMDPIERIRIAGDTGFALMLEAQARGHSLYTYTPDKLSMRDGKVTAPMRPVNVRDVDGDYFTAGAEEKVDLSTLDVVLLRQDPPFDMAYVTTTHMLERIHPKTLVVNDPTSVRNAPEKILVTHFPELMPPTLITRDKAEIEAFRDEHGEIVMKPLYGHGGATVFKTGKGDPNFGSLFDLFSNLFREPWVVQGFIKEVTEGDKRIILIDGKAAGAVNRVPAVGDLRANMVRGGAARPTDLSKQELAICEAIGPTLRERGLLLVGIDVIHGKLTEINVTAPTGVRAIKKLGGPDLAAQLFDVIEAKRGR